MELVIDGSSESNHAALSQQGRIAVQATWRSAQNHTTELLPTINWLMQRARVEVSALTAIVVGTGPGSFNGLRVAMSTAKGLAFSLGIPLVGVSSLEAEAYAFAWTGMPLCPIRRAGRDRIAAALYRRDGERWLCLEREHLTTLEQLRTSPERTTFICGDTAVELADELRDAMGPHTTIACGSAGSQPASLAALGWDKLCRGQTDDPATLQPLYLRPPHITKPRERTPRSGVAKAES